MRRGLRRTAVAVWLGTVLAVGACQPAPEPVEVQRTQLTVLNGTPQDWHDVEIWVNDHYRVLVRSITAGQRLRVPLDTFVAGFGQRFDPDRQVVQGVEVTARTADGRDITLTWGKGRRR